MTLCTNCRPWAATTRGQLINRVENMAESASFNVHPCPKCGGTEWAITDEMVTDQDTHSLGAQHGNVVAGLATLSAIIIILMVVIGWWER